MTDLISRAALLKECVECQKTDPYFDGRGWASHFINEAGEPSTEWYCVEDMIENAPAVDAAPVVHTSWIDIPGRPNWDQKMCSACGDYFCCHNSYCPNCGAKMDGKRRESK